MEPKAKWSAYDEDTKRIWTAAVGPFYLDVNSVEGTCEICEWDAESADIGRTLWKRQVTLPCDVTDLMRLTEAELARRLELTAKTMDGAELVVAGNQQRLTIATRPDGTLIDVATPIQEGSSAAIVQAVAPQRLAFSEIGTPPHPVQSQRLEGNKLIVQAVGVPVGRNNGVVQQPHPRVAFAHQDALRKTYARLQASPRGKTAIPEKEATVYDLGAMLGLALCFPSVPFTLNLERRTLEDVAKELVDLAYDQRDIVAAPNVYRTALNCLHEVLGGPTEPMQEAWRRSEEDGVFPPRNLTIVEAKTLKHEVTEQSVEPRFKVGDLVRVHDHVGTVTGANAWTAIVRHASDGLTYAYSVTAVAPYELPTITSYADLANVLDELPEGTLIEGNSRREAVWYRRSSRGREALLPGHVSWTALAENTWEIPGNATFRIVPTAPVGSLTQPCSSCPRASRCIGPRSR